LTVTPVGAALAVTAKAMNSAARILLQFGFFMAVYLLGAGMKNTGRGTRETRSFSRLAPRVPRPVIKQNKSDTNAKGRTPQRGCHVDVRGGVVVHDNFFNLAQYKGG